MPKTKKTPKNLPSHGLCKLTKKHGKHVKSHLIPESLTRPSVRGNYFLQFGQSGRPLRRWTSWYDKKLVCEKGEKYLSDLDDWAVKELRKQKLIWSGWGTQRSIKYISSEGSKGIGLRVVSGIDKIRIRLFFLSLLWRAAATDLDEFSPIVLSEEDLERLRLMIVEGQTEPLSFYPCLLTQLTTLGRVHNQSPIRDTTTVPNLDDGNGDPIRLPIYRFYFDGLVAHIHLDLPESYSVENLRGIIVGSDDNLVVTAVDFENSRQRYDLESSVIR